MGIITTVCIVILVIYGIASVLENEDKILKWWLIVIATQIVGLVGLFVPSVFFDGDIKYWSDIILGYIVVMVLTWIIGIIAYATRK